MGTCLSKICTRRGNPPAPNLHVAVNGGAATAPSSSSAAAADSCSSKVQYVAALSSYEAACRLDPELRSFDTTLHARTSRAISTLASGVEVRSLSFDSLREVTACLLDMNQEVVKVILACKQDVWNSPHLFDLVEEYFDNSLHTLDFCAALERCLHAARDGQLVLHAALRRFAAAADELDDEAVAVELPLQEKTCFQTDIFCSKSDPNLSENCILTDFARISDRIRPSKIFVQNEELDEAAATVESPLQEKICFQTDIFRSKSVPNLSENSIPTDFARISKNCSKSVPNLSENSISTDFARTSKNSILIDFARISKNCIPTYFTWISDGIHLSKISVRKQVFSCSAPSGGGAKYARTLEELRRFRTRGDPFTEDFFRVLQSVHRQQLSMLEKLHRRKRKLDRRLRSVKSWRRVSSIIFAAAFASVLICSVVAAAVAAPPVAAALAAAAAVPLGSMGKWFDSLWKNYQDALTGHRELVGAMQVGAFVVVKDLDNIRVMVEQVETQMRSLMQAAEFAERDDGGGEEEEAVRVAVEEIRRKLGAFMRSIEELGEQADVCSRDIRRARTVVLQKIIKHPN